MGVTQKTAWFMLRRVRLAIQDEHNRKLSGEFEVDETFIGGKARNMYKSKLAEKIQGRGAVEKTVVQRALKRGGQVRAMVIDDRDQETLQANLEKTSARVPMCSP